MKFSFVRPPQVIEIESVNWITRVKVKKKWKRLRICEALCKKALKNGSQTIIYISWVN